MKRGMGQPDPATLTPNADRDWSKFWAEWGGRHVRFNGLVLEVTSVRVSFHKATGGQIRDGVYAMATLRAKQDGIYTALRTCDVDDLVRLEVVPEETLGAVVASGTGGQDPTAQTDVPSAAPVRSEGAR